MKIVYIGTYPPRQYGISVFTSNLLHSMVTSPPNAGSNGSEKAAAVEGIVVAMNDHGLTYAYPEEVKLTIGQEQQRDYLEAVKFINLSGADLCILEHEFGIFGAQNGIYI